MFPSFSPDQTRREFYRKVPFDGKVRKFKEIKERMFRNSSSANNHISHLVEMGMYRSQKSIIYREESSIKAAE